MSWKTFWESTKDVLDELRRLLILLLLAAGVAMVAVLAWRNMNWVTFALFALVFWWIGYHERRHYNQLDTTVDIAEKRLWALEQRTGLDKAWLDELKSARLNQKCLGGPLARHVYWPQPQTSDWEEWEAKYKAVMKEMPADGVGYTEWKKRVEQVRAEQPLLDEDDELIAEAERELGETA